LLCGHALFISKCPFACIARLDALTCFAEALSGCRCVFTVRECAALTPTRRNVK